MKERILKIMEREQMSPSKFSEEIGIQRSALSHILNGRNKASLEVLMKILGRFDYLSTDWLLFGKGSMFRPDKLVFQPQLFDESGVSSHEDRLFSEYAKEKELKDKDNVSDYRMVPEKSIVAVQCSPQKCVSKILLFYSDNTFETFVPLKEE